eukprot:6887369-Prymnesium_polylepis.1
MLCSLSRFILGYSLDMNRGTTWKWFHLITLSTTRSPSPAPRQLPTDGAGGSSSFFTRRMNETADRVGKSSPDKLVLDGLAKRSLGTQDVLVTPVTRNLHSCSPVTCPVTGKCGLV